MDQAEMNIGLRLLLAIVAGVVLFLGALALGAAGMPKVPFGPGVLITLAAMVPIGEVVGWAVPKLIDRRYRDPKVPKESMPPLVWADLLARGPGGPLLGVVERLVLFGCLVAGTSAVIVAWLAFKVAASWQSAQTLSKLPSWLIDHTDVHRFRARTLWASYAFVSFAAETGVNLAVALAAFGFFRWLTH